MEIKHLCFAYGNAPIINDLNFSIQEGKITTLLGPNGCGKTTLFRLITRNLTPAKGEVCIQDRNIYQLGRRDFARGVAIVQQNNTCTSDITVEQLVAFGRTPYQNFYGTKTRKDQQEIEKAMEITGITQYRDRAMGTLSGGQKQRVWIAMALAQNPKYLFLDEPTTYLDIRYQVGILELVRKLNEKYGMTVVMVLHDINQALAYSHEIFGMRDGKILFSGDPNQVITKENMRALYDIQMEVMTIGTKKHVIVERAVWEESRNGPEEGNVQ